MDSLPSELLVSIFRYFKSIDRLPLRLVCKQFGDNIYAYNDIETFQIKKEYKNNVEQLARSLKNIKLVMYDNPEVTDVSALGSVHTLDLSWCENLRDVSALSSVHILYLVGCDGITDVSNLGSVHKLVLSWCKNLRDVSALSGVHTLELVGCDGLTDISALSSVHTLNISLCDNITDISMLHNVHTLNMHGCRNIPSEQINELKNKGVNVQPFLIKF